MTEEHNGYLISGSALPGPPNADGTTTLKIYSHFIPKMKTDSAARFAASIFNPQQLGHFVDTSEKASLEEPAVNAR